MSDSTVKQKTFASKAHAELEALYLRYHKPEFLSTDPLWYAHQYSRPGDREVVALLASGFAFGNAKAFRKVLEGVLNRLGPHPAETLKRLSAGECREHSAGFVYRWIQGEDLALYVARLGELLRRYGSLKDCFETHRRGAVAAPGVWALEPGLQAMAEEYQGIWPAGICPRERVLKRASGAESALPTAADGLFPRLSKGSACKRTFLFLRWVCRPADGIDLGLWPVDPALLLMPVDTHVFQAARRLRLVTGVKSVNRGYVEKLTAKLARFDASDPTRFDFSLTRPGMMGEN
jgi:uncharacterized protein (TIGR02757 family)